MRRLGLLLLLSLVANGCAQMKLVEAKRTSIADLYSVEPERRWASIPARPGLEAWTVDGPALNEVIFVKGVADGEAIFRGPISGGAPDDDKRPKFQGWMTPNDIAELFVDSYALFRNQKIETRGLRPAIFGTQDGFRFEMTWVTPSGLDMRGLVAGAVIKNRLHAIVYSAPRAHYFEKYRGDVERLLASIRFQ